jgi:hypothetical protein
MTRPMRILSKGTHEPRRSRHCDHCVSIVAYCLSSRPRQRLKTLLSRGAKESIDPTVAANSRLSRTPSRNATRGNAHDAAFALGPSPELRMAQQTASVFGDFKGPNIEVDQTHPIVAQSFVEEVAVSAHQRRAAQASQQGKDLVVFHSFATNIPANLAEVNTPLAQLCALTLEDVLVQHNHAQTGLSRYSSAC